MARATASTRFHTSVDGGSKSRVPLTALIKVVWEIPCYHAWQPLPHGRGSVCGGHASIGAATVRERFLSLHLAGQHVHQFLHRRGALVQLRRLVFGEFELVDLL